jgi:hypothetical protein
MIPAGNVAARLAIPRPDPAGGPVLTSAGNLGYCRPPAVR